jgi:hypothetical protein
MVCEGTYAASGGDNGSALSSASSLGARTSALGEEVFGSAAVHSLLQQKADAGGGAYRSVATTFQFNTFF